MTRTSIAGGLLAFLLGMLAASCGGTSTPNPPNPNPGFTRMTAVVTDAAGAAMPGLTVRVDGQPTGVVTSDQGEFVLTAADFPNGANALAELAFGKGGIVIGTREVVPSEQPNVQIRFGENTGTGTATVHGVVYENTANPTAAPNGASDPALPFAPTTLDGVQVTLFDAAAGAVFQTTTANGGQYSFADVAGGTWQMSAQLDGYYSEMAALRVEDGAETRFDFVLTAKGRVEPGEGIKVRGTLVDSETDEPIAGATVNLYADTGYAYIDPMPGEAPRPDGSVPPPSDTPAGAPGNMPGKQPLQTMIAPDLYRPQYQTTVTGADGSFSFPEEVAGYSLWLDFSAPNYLAGTHYEDIYSRSSDLNLALELSPVIPTGVHGRVVNGSGAPVNGARVEFIFGGGYMGGGPAVPGFTNFEDVADQGSANFDEIGAPVPGKEVPPAPPAAPDGWDDSNGAPSAGGGAAAPGGGGSGNGFDNGLMQRFLWEQQQKGSSDVASDFSGYVAVYTDANGEYSVEDIPAGPYYVMASAYKHLPYAGEAQLDSTPADNELDVTLPEVPVGSVEGTITDEHGNPVTDTLVNATQPNVDPFTYTDGSGHFRIDNVPAGQWLISAFKSGYLTASETVDIAENGVVTVNLQLERYDGPDATTFAFSGAAINGYDNSTVSGADIVFTPVDPALGGYARHVVTGDNGSYSTTLVPNTDINVLIQKSGYEDIFFRFWADEFNPRMDFWLWPVGAPGGTGGWNGGGRPGPGPDPMPGGDVATGVDNKG